jgi:hypothetical protein
LLLLFKYPPCFPVVPSVKMGLFYAIGPWVL